MTTAIKNQPNNSVDPAFAAFFKPIARTRGGKKLWAADVETFWVGKALASNVMGYTDVPLEDLGAPIRAARDQNTGEVKFTQSGRVATTVATGLREYVSGVQENVFASLNQFEGMVREERAAEFERIVQMADLAGKPVRDRDTSDTEAAIKARQEAAAQAEAAQAVACTQVVPEPEPKSKKPHQRKKAATVPEVPASNGATPEPVSAS